ncbi:transcriptional regulator [Subtercola sp. PAMC28395]|uniref:helix-turn-helix domain-containing protein n=1 Tax=Subtercola sp. PAMC28395 TaxID=2846775 RepID=UPI001C0B475D|nr:helix-turn-helix domain-containing protein [Subtercola sp. PAMC28395]QWT23134.1 transcriptional regulator [Subtercola sp. PAMC28395]
MGTDYADAAGVRRLVEESWMRSLARKLDPDTLLPRFDLDDETLREYRREHPLSLVLPIIHRLLIAHTFESGLIVAIGDQAGRLLWIDGDRELRRRAEGMYFVEGADWSEASVGTSAPGTALALDHGIQIGGAEHFNRIVHPWSCTAVPVHDPATGDILGVIDITGGDNAVSPATMPLLEAAVAAAESELRIHQLARAHPRLGLTTQLRLPPRPGDTAGWPGAGGHVVANTAAAKTAVANTIAAINPTAAINTAAINTAVSMNTATSINTVNSAISGAPGNVETRARSSSSTKKPRATDARQLSVLGREVGRLTVGAAANTVELSARHTEILTLLAWHRRGLSAEQLAQKLYTADNSVATLRAEIVRLRAVLAEVDPSVVIESRPYRLATPLELDAHRVLAFLERGAHRVALAAYVGPVVMGSTAPGVVEIRAEISANVRESLMTDASADVLLAYAHTDECAYDREVWIACLQRLPAQSPKRASVVSRIERIDAELRR